MTAMVDSGAKRSAIRADLIANRKSFPIRHTTTCWRTADGGIAQNVLGETALTIRYKGHVVELPRVVVMTNQVTPFILGIEWIDAMKAAVSTKNGKGVVTLEKKEVPKRDTGEQKNTFVEPEQEEVENEVVIEGPARDWTSFRARIRSRTIYRRSLEYVKFVFSLPAGRLSREKTEIRKSSYTPEDYVAKIRTGFELGPIIEMPHYEEFVARNERKSSKN